MSQYDHLFDTPAAYIAASSESRRNSVAVAASSITSNNFGPESHGHRTSQQVGYFPTDDECKQLANPVRELLSRCRCYEVLGTSTQVVLLDVDVELTTAFIAAQERGLAACVLWDREECAVCGVLSSTDYIEILLYCSDHPDEAERVPQYTIRYWREKVRNYKPSGTVNAGATEAETLANSFDRLCSLSPVPPLITCTSETSVSECLAQIMNNKAKRIVVLVEKESEDFNVKALLDLQQILSYLGALFLSVESQGSGPRGVSADTAMSSSITSREASDYAEGTGGPSALEAVSGYRPFIDSVVASNSEFSRGGVTLPLHVRNLHDLVLNEGRENPVDFGSYASVGPYKAITDVPFRFVPQLGQHRKTPISVTLETPFLDALRLLLLHNIDCIAVVSENDVVVDAIGRSDIVRIEDNGVYNTQLTVRGALGDRPPKKIRVFYENDTLREIFIFFVRQRVRELFLVDPNTKKLRGQLNISEVVFFLVFGTTNTNNPSKSQCGCGT
ncbi:hypothetical protein, conserved [Trypanosoma brucei brucei TREU927]|uniref:CBS domain-containing protein n=1 Tax=Trypanosoma brucei brucei (strain 927/4 GUTat10.1) TaxID=185431 RepID=Q38BM9_TRYB2|nr:hypothetical protein, conserved [Trypanosoma brucei brucei TREU927]EAN77791.1 hypothetical protein, conserved [Trypanosoma brucei brucei TREU927]